MEEQGIEGFWDKIAQHASKSPAQKHKKGLFHALKVQTKPLP